MEQLLDFIGKLVPITGNSAVDTIIFFVIGAIAFAASWWITGLVAYGVGYDSKTMSGIHWLVRGIIFIGLMLFAIGLTHLIRWFLSFEWWVYLIIGISICLITGGIIILRIYLKKKRPITVEEE